MENAKQAYDAFNRLWAKVPRSIRLDRENHQLMLDIRAFFDGAIEIAKRAAIVDTALSAAKASPNGESGDDEPADPVRLALRLLRTLDGREWAMIKAIVDLHKFETGDFLDILDAIHDTHCPRCGEWLDDDDAHENCPVPAEDEDMDATEAEPAAAKTADSNMCRPTGAEVQNAVEALTAPPRVVTATTLSMQAPQTLESEPKIVPRE